MPRNSQGVYDLPVGSIVQIGQDIIPSQHNVPLQDIGQALSGSLPRDGSAGMQGQLKVLSGDVANPALAFPNSGTGLYMTSSGAIGIAVNGQQAAVIGSAGIIGLYVGMPIPLLDDTLPALCVWPDGRNVLRSAYPKLFAKWGTKFGAGDGSTTFGMPDLRGRSLIGKDNFGGTDASRLTGVTFGSGDRLTTGSVLGAATVALAAVEMPSHTHDTAVSYPAQKYDKPIGVVAGGGGVPTGGFTNIQPNADTVPPGPQTFTSTSAGSGTAHLNVQPSMTCSWAIFAGE